MVSLYKKRKVYPNHKNYLLASFPSRLIILIVRVRWARCTFLRTQPLNVSQASADLSVLEILLGHLLLLAGAESHISRILGAAVGGARGGAGDDAACHGGDGAGDAAAGAGILEAIGGDGEVTLVGDASISDVPLLGAERANKLLVMGNHDDTTLVVADSNSETTEGVTVQEIGRLVEDEEMGVIPHGACEDDLDLLAAGEAGDLVVVCDFGVETQVFEVLGDDFGGELAEAEAFAGGFVVVEFLDELAEAAVDEGFAGDLGVVLGEHELPFTGSLLAFYYLDLG